MKKQMMAMGEEGDFRMIGSNVRSGQEVGLALCSCWSWRYEEELKMERDNVSSWTWLIEVKMEIGTRSKSREGTRWMGKHVEVDFVDSTHPSTTSNSFFFFCISVSSSMPYHSTASQSYDTER